MRTRQLVLRFVVLFIMATAAGFWLTRSGVATWDSQAHLDQSRWIIAQTTGVGTAKFDPVVMWYGPLWETVLGLFSELLLPFLHDPTGVRYSLTFALLPTTLALVYVLLRKAGQGRATALLSAALCLGCIRFGGHSILNTKDFPLACAYVVVTLALWLVLASQQRTAINQRFRPSRLAMVCLLALVPYLVRPPMLFHFLGLWLWFACAWLFEGSGEKRSKWYLLAPLPLLVAWVAVLWPAFRWRPMGWLESFSLFSKFGWQEPVVAFGKEYVAADLPRWYPLSWFGVALEPVTLLVMVAGLGYLLWSTVRTRGHVESSDVLAAPYLTLPRRKMPIPLEVWVAGFALLPLGANLVVQPSLYDEERHILFLFPIFLVAAGLGLRRLPAPVKTLLAASVLAGSISAYAEWGRYSYVYKSAIVGDTSSRRFMGDYWALCLNEALLAIPRHVSPSAPVLVAGPLSVVEIQAQRLSESLLSPLPAFGPYQWLPFRAPVSGEVVVAYFRNGGDRVHFDAVESALHAGRAEALARVQMPPGETACLLARYL